MPASSVVIRPMLDSEVEAVVEVHLRTFTGFFLSFLGRRFLVQLYRAIRSAPEGVVLVAAGEEGIEGFVAGVTSQQSFYRRLVRKHWWRFAMSALGAAIRKPSVIPRLLRALRRPSDIEHSAVSAALMSIGVAPESEGRGVGGLLIESFCREMAARGVVRYMPHNGPRRQCARSSLLRKARISCEHLVRHPRGQSDDRVHPRIAKRGLCLGDRVVVVLT